MDEIRTCALCGITGRGVSAAVVNWAGWRAGHGFAYETVDRCRDHAACEARVAAAQKPWPLRRFDARLTFERPANRIIEPDPDLPIARISEAEQV